MARRWSVTSDSLAAWLAGRLGASQLLLVKSLKLTAAKTGAGELARRGVIDETLPELLARALYSCRIVAAPDHREFAAAIDGDRGIGTLVMASTASAE
jgi:aspartokinase-like uncharacterized kinase